MFAGKGSAVLKSFIEMFKASFDFAFNLRTVHHKHSEYHFQLPIAWDTYRSGK